MSEILSQIGQNRRAVGIIVVTRHHLVGVVKVMDVAQRERIDVLKRPAHLPDILPVKRHQNVDLFFAIQREGR